MERVQAENYQHLRQRTLTQPAIGSISDKKRIHLIIFFSILELTLKHLKKIIAKCISAFRLFYSTQQ